MVKTLVMLGETADIYLVSADLNGKTEVFICNAIILLLHKNLGYGLESHSNCESQI